MVSSIQVWGEDYAVSNEVILRNDPFPWLPWLECALPSDCKYLTFIVK